MRIRQGHEGGAPKMALVAVLVEERWELEGLLSHHEMVPSSSDDEADASDMLLAFPTSRSVNQINFCLFLINYLDSSLVF